MTTLTNSTVRLFASSKSWIEGEAVRQLNATAQLEGMTLAVGFPDLHPGKYTANGAAFVSEGVIYPHLIGNDIGCGMALFATDLPRRKAKLDAWTKLQFQLEHPWDGDVAEALAAAELNSTEFDNSFGTLGGGNHFAELQTVERIFDATDFKRVGVEKDAVVVLVHSGSRGLGEAILRNFVDEHHGSGVDPDSLAGADYLREHDVAVRWAKGNRQLLAQRFLQTIGASGECVWDNCHNSITRFRSRRGDEADAFIHRKGAVTSEGEIAVIPGSRGSLTYVVKPIGDGASHAWSLAHGAGRKWTRSASRARMRERFSVHELQQTPLGGRVICEERDLLYEEAPAAYKNIEAVINDLVEAGLISVIATFRPLLTYKTRAQRR
jgi:release factor H-coupled RctB family protein